MTPQKSLRPFPSREWILLPLRLFLGVTFVYAGIQKITDPQFFNPAKAGYIGKQLASFSIGSPIGGLMVHLVPHAALIGVAIILGEIAIGLGTLFGFLLRPAAFFGMILSITFFLTASFHVYPYFYGADIVFTFAWLTMLLNGPLHSGYPTLDELLVKPLLTRLSVAQQQIVAPVFALILGISTTREPDIASATTMPQYVLEQQNRYGQQSQLRGQTRIQQQRKQDMLARADENRRNFLLGGIGGCISGLAIFGFASLLLRGNQQATTGGSSTGTTAPNGGTAGGSGGSGNTIAQVSAVPKNSSVSFTIPSNGDPGVLIHLNNDQFVAFDATCTHAGCPVAYDAGSQLLQCPCHGAAFDPAKNAEVVNPPAQSPLTQVQIHVDSATGAITLAGGQ